jgi:tRNA G26 N,N-dimethylase Trm1
LTSLATSREESLVQGELYQRLDLIASALRKQTPPRHRMVEELRARGFKATTTHYHPVAIRTDASPRELFELI